MDGGPYEKGGKKEEREEGRKEGREEERKDVNTSVF